MVAETTKGTTDLCSTWWNGKVDGEEEEEEDQEESTELMGFTLDPIWIFLWTLLGFS